MSDPARIERRKPWKVIMRGGSPNVVLEWDGTPIDDLHPDTAIDIAIALYDSAKLQKRKFGLAPRVHGFAKLTDAVADELEMQRRKDHTAAFAKPSL